jgi:hypothetical protein
MTAGRRGVGRGRCCSGDFSSVFAVFGGASGVAKTWLFWLRVAGAVRRTEVVCDGGWWDPERLRWVGWVTGLKCGLLACLRA